MKKILSVLVVMLMGVFMLVGCAGTNNTGNTGNGGDNNTNGGIDKNLPMVNENVKEGFDIEWQTLIDKSTDLQDLKKNIESFGKPALCVKVENDNEIVYGILYVDNLNEYAALVNKNNKIVCSEDLAGLLEAFAYSQSGELPLEDREMKVISDYISITEFTYRDLEVIDMDKENLTMFFATINIQKAEHTKYYPSILPV